MYLLLAILSAIIFSIAPQCGAIETIAIAIMSFILLCFSINIETRVKILTSKNISNQSIYKKTTPYSARIMIVVSIIVCIAFLLMVLFIAALGIILCIKASDTFSGLAIIKIVTEEKWNTVGLFLTAIATICYCCASINYIKYCKNKLSVVKGESDER